MSNLSQYLLRAPNGPFVAFQAIGDARGCAGAGYTLPSSDCFPISHTAQRRRDTIVSSSGSQMLLVTAADVDSLTSWSTNETLRSNAFSWTIHEREHSKECSSLTWNFGPNVTYDATLSLLGWIGNHQEFPTPSAWYARGTDVARPQPAWLADVQPTIQTLPHLRLRPAATIRVHSPSWETKPSMQRA